MALTANEVNQLHTLGYSDSQIQVMTDREARQKIAASNGTVEGPTSGGTGLPSGGNGFAAWSDGLFNMVGTLGTAFAGLGSTVVATQNGYQPPVTQPPATGNTFLPQVFTPEVRSNAVWWIVGGVVVVGLGIALFFGLRKK